MRTRTSVAFALSLLLATTLHAQDAAVEDASGGDASVSDGAAAEDVNAPTADAAVVADATVLDSAVVEDAAVAADASAIEDAATVADAGLIEDATTAIDSGPSDDATVADAAGPGCGTVTFTGECDGNTVRYCAGDNEVVEIDCVSEYGSSATCGLADCTDPDNCLGYYCVASSGGSCVDLGCDIEAAEGCVDGTCQASTTCDPATYTPSCDGDKVTYCAHTVSDNDCSEGGTQPYTCGDGPDGVSACIGTASGLCDLASGYGCADGLDCVGGVCSAPGSDAGVIDSGTGGDAASDPDAKDPGCACAAQDVAGPGSLLLLLGLVSLLVRRRP